MKKLRYGYLGICLGFLIGICFQNINVFAESGETETEHVSLSEINGEGASEGTDSNSEDDSRNYGSEEDSDSSTSSSSSSGSSGSSNSSAGSSTTDGSGTSSGESSSSSEMTENVGVANNVKIKSYNPGYSNQGEFVELLKLSKNDISLAGLQVIYVTSSGKEYLVHEFSQGSEMVGESLLMRLASSNEVQEVEDFHEVADLTYTRNMSQSKGRIKLVFEENIVDTVCWGLEDDDCFPAFKSSKPTTLVRDLSAEEVEDSFKHIENYVPSYDREKPGLKIIEVPEEIVEPRCRTIEFSEILTYFENSNTEQFIEIFNRSEEKVELSRCFLRYKNKNYALSGEIGANGFLVFYNVPEWGLSLTKNPTSSNTLEIIDADGEVVDKLVYSSGQRKGVSLAMIGFKADGSENWAQTYNVTPGRENIYQQYKTCPIGKVINLETGNCVNETSLVTTLAECPEGKYRNPLTGRCKSYATTASAELKPCAEGYERNPETGRCRKIVKNDGASYELKPETFEEKSEFVAIWSIVAVIAVGVMYILFQYREEIAGAFRKNR
ncbi:lamin tail domain-containing protein [Candidatus Saccharibacteria bacterium]|nr:lamin tail domain-containing protein [Candidatus Saccharibacteria bacterium]